MTNTKRYYWLKLPKSFFGQKEIKKLRNIAGGDTYTIIYLKMALLSITDGGRLFFDNIEDDFASEIALELDEEVENVKVTINYLQSVGLLEYIETDELFLTDVPAMIGSESESAARVRKSRNRKKALQCNTIETLCNTEIEKEIEIEIDTKKEVETQKIDYQLIADMYNDTCVSFPRLKTLSDSRKKAIKARLRVYTLEDFKTLFEKAEASSFLKGSNERNWSANFDWLIKDSNMAKVLEGNYDYKPKTGRKEVVPSWANKEQHQYDFNELEKELVCNSPELQQRAEELKRRIEEG